ncbi:hypothetical protein D3C77_34390 [compost metagenome]
MLRRRDSCLQSTVSIPNKRDCIMFERIQKPTRVRSEGEQVKQQRRLDERARQEGRGKARKEKRHVDASA